MHQFTLTLLRHGETVSPKSLNGSTNVDISDKGHQQMLDACSTLKNIEHVSSSPLQRCAKVASLIAEKWKTPFEIHTQLSEMDFGDWDGQTLDLLFEKHPQQMDQFFNAPWQTQVPNGESIKDFYERVDVAWLAHINLRKNSLIVCHGGVIRYLIAKILEMPLKGNKHISALKIDYAAIVQINIIIDDENIVWPTLIWPNAITSE